MRLGLGLGLGLDCAARAGERAHYDVQYVAHAEAVGLGSGLEYDPLRLREEDAWGRGRGWG